MYATVTYVHASEKIEFATTKTLACRHPTDTHPHK